MTDLDILDKIDLLRERVNVSYEEAKGLLEKHDGNVVDALIAFEHQEKSRRGQVCVRGSELVDRAKELLRRAQVTKIRVKQDGRVVLDLPVTVGMVGAVIAPELAVLGALTALATKCTVEVEHAPADALR